MADIEKEKKRSKKKSTEASSSQPEASGSSWRDFITNASAALDDLATDVVNNLNEDITAQAEPEASEVPRAAEPSAEPAENIAETPAPKKKRGKKKSAAEVAADAVIENIEWSNEARTLDIKDTSSEEEETLSRFEQLARQVAQTVAEQNEIISDDKPEGLGNDSGEPKEELSAAELGDEPETTFDMEAGETNETPLIEEEGMIAEETEPGEEVIAASSEKPAETSTLDFAMEPEVTFEAGAEQLDMLSEPATEGASAPGAEASGDASADADLDSAADASEPEVQEPTEFIESDQLMSIIESLLFSTDKPVSIATIKQIFKGSNIRTKDITRAMDLLASEFAAPSRGVSLEEVNGGYQLRTKSDNADYLRRLAKVRPFRLSGPALEVMAIVAYKQPITKHEVDEIRGVESGHLLRALMERGLINFVGKSDLPGKPMTYGSTRKFLETFGLRNLKELPTLSEIDELIPEGIGEVEEKETLSDITDRMSTEITATYSEGEDELLKINEQLQKVDTTSEFFEQEKQRERERRDRDRAQEIRERILVGELVEEKDRRWLDRFDAKMAEGAPIADGVPVEANEIVADFVSPEGARETDGDQTPAFSEQLEALSEESTQTASSTDDEDELDTEDASWMQSESESDDGDDLSGNLDWDDEKES